jgi:hypothetical protein
MGKDKYNVTAKSDHLAYEFISEGPKGNIAKIVVYQHMFDNFYNLAFGDFTNNDEILDDLIVSDNGDTAKILFTVASTLFDFFQHYEGTIVFAQGSKYSRNRLYRRYLSQFLDIITENFMLLGELDGKVERFQKGKDYTSFYIHKY